MLSVGSFVHFSADDATKSLAMSEKMSPSRILTRSSIRPARRSWRWFKTLRAGRGPGSFTLTDWNDHNRRYGRQFGTVVGHHLVGPTDGRTMPGRRALEEGARAGPARVIGGQFAAN